MHPGQENEKWPPPDELPEFRKQHWSFVRRIRGCTGRTLPCARLGEIRQGWSDCHQCWEKRAWTGKCWLSMEGISCLPAGEVTVRVPPLSFQPSVVLSSFSTMLCVNGWREGKRLKRKFSKYFLSWEKRHVSCSVECEGIWGKSLRTVVLN